MTERLGPDALRELFLFEKLSDEQLAWLAERGEVRSYPAGAMVYAAGEPATRLFVLLEGTLSMTVRAGGAAAPTPVRSSPTWTRPAPACTRPASAR